jgi:ribosomal protein L35
MANKLKTHKGIAKRIKITKNNKLIHKKANNRHLLSNKASANDKFKMGKQIHESDVTSVRTLLPYSAR